MVSQLTLKIRMIEEHHYVKLMMTLCVSHWGNNAGQEAGSPCLYRYWTNILEKIFAYFEKAKTIWEEENGVSWKTFTENRWYSPYEVFAAIYLNFACNERVAICLVNKELAPRNSSCLLKMLQDPSTRWTLNIDFSALVEGLAAIVKRTDKMEGDTQLVFKVGESVNGLLALYQGGRVCTLPSASRLIENH
jgi:hypothetical protein